MNVNDDKSGNPLRSLLTYTFRVMELKVVITLVKDSLQESISIERENVRLNLIRHGESLFLHFKTE